MKKLTPKQKDLLTLAPLVVICLIVLSMYLTYLARIRQEVEPCYDIETYEIEDLEPEEPKQYEDLDNVELTDQFNQQGKMVDKPKTMRSWVLKEASAAGLNATEVDCIISKESSWNPKATGYNKDKVQSHDRGLWMINSYWHREISDSCAYDYKCATKKAIKIRKARDNWSAWYGARKCNIK